MSMILRLLLSVLILPVNVLVVIPGILLWLFDGTYVLLTPAWWVLLSAALIGLAGLSLGVWTVCLFVSLGKGTPAPWDPPQTLVIKGPYRYVRNPMLSGVFLMLTAEALALQSVPLVCWTATFVIANLIYMPLVEEKSLERRYGQEYREYRTNIPRWIPRIHP